ncbi:hypothetical protein FZEAL_10982, partial [Fusarium zealandicum]
MRFLSYSLWAFLASSAVAFKHSNHENLLSDLPWVQINNGTNTCGQAGLFRDYSGYIRVDGAEEQASMFFWFFEARHKPEDAPVILYLNGGPGMSSTYRVFDGTGPCIFPPGHDKPVANPLGFNEYANVLYVDQPVGTGFSFGNANIFTTHKATE